MKTYVLTVSQKFPKYHQRAGDDTNFADLILDAIMTKNLFIKIHTMRQNYDLWAKRFEKINKGEAQLSIRKWAGKPYASKQEVIINLTKDDGIGLEKLQLNETGWVINGFNGNYDINLFAKNDGLHKKDWIMWFPNSFDYNSSLAIIHFTPFRYCV